jgi:DNA-binding Xre family transcriptional regulator
MSYKKLFKMLIDLDMMKKDLAAGCGLSTASMAKLARGKNVNTDVLVRVCNFLRCEISDICEVILDEEEPVKQAQDEEST